jgi:hypothetical protein
VKSLAFVLGVLFIITGVVWILQGVNLLPGSFMTGQTRWAINGLLAAGIGIGLLVYAKRRGSSPRK